MAEVLEADYQPFEEFKHELMRKCSFLDYVYDELDEAGKLEFEKFQAVHEFIEESGL